MDKENALYTYSGILGHKRGQLCHLPQYDDLRVFISGTSQRERLKTMISLMCEEKKDNG